MAKSQFQKKCWIITKLFVLFVSFYLLIVLIGVGLRNGDNPVPEELMKYNVALVSSVYPDIRP